MDFFSIKTTEFLMAAGALIAVLTAGYYVIQYLRRDLHDDGCPVPEEVLDPLRKAYELGSMGSGEYERVQALLGTVEPGGLEAELKAARKRQKEKALKESQDRAKEEGPTPRTSGSDGPHPESG